MSSRIIRASESQQNSQAASGEMGVSPKPITTAAAAIDAEKQAFEQGYKEGERCGRQVAEQALQSAVQNYELGVQKLASAELALQDAMHVETARLALHIARKIIQREATVDPDLVAALITVAIKRAQGHHGVEIRVSSHDHRRVSEAMRGANSTIPVKEDALLGRGDFILDSVESHFDGRISSQIDAIERALFDE